MKGERHASRPVGSDRRAQSVFDFSIGVSLFLVVVLAVFVFVPTAFGAINDSGPVSEADRLAAERAVDYLAGTALADASTQATGPRTLQASCAIAFFNDTDGCGFESNNDVSVDAGFTTRRPLNVTVEGDRDAGEPLCWDAGGGRLVNASSSNCNPSSGDVPFRNTMGGSNAALNQEFATATRSARLDNRTVFVVARTW